MKVFGVNDRKEVVATDLSVEEVVREGVHPWWVDLFDPHPVVREVGGTRLALTRVRSFSFQVTDGAEALVGVLRGGQFHAFTGRIENPRYNNQPPFLKDPRARNVRFETAFARFISAYERADKNNKPLACSEGGLRVERGNLLFMTDLWHDLVPAYVPLNGPAFAGRMFEGLRLRQELPPQINWVFGAFDGWNPTVIGGALRDALSGRSPADVDFIVDHRGGAFGQSEVVHARLKKIGATSIVNRTDCNRYGHMLENPIFSFVYDGVKYDLISRGNPLSDNFWRLNDFSATQLRADRPNEVTASRVALYDLGHRQCRLVSSARSNSSKSEGSNLRYRWPDRAKKMEEKGFTVLPNPFGTDQYDTL